MDWNDLLKTTRLTDKEYEARQGRPMYVQDLDRITFSAPFRRLANKTQVHPLYDNDHIHHRLIHSVEVSSVGRTLGMDVGQWLVDDKALTDIKPDKMSGIVQAACLAHDIGNPPFGHSGEAAIGAWFEERLAAPKGLFERLDAKHHQEFKKFEGNAQGFRILARKEMYVDEGGMRLSLAVLGAFTKYPATANVSAEAPETYCGLKKYGLFENDAGLFAEAAAALGLPERTSANGRWWKRHPLVFLMEAADDICYNIMDLEDAFTCGDVPFAQARDLLAALFPKSNSAHRFVSPAAEMAYMRARAVGGAIMACVDAFKANYDGLMDGTFSSGLIEVSSKADEFKRIRELARERIFKAPRKTELEVFGRNVIYKTLDGLFPLFDALGQAGWKADALSSYHQQLARALDIHLDDLDNAYDALHALTDFVSGMTDRYAVKVSEMLYSR